MNISSVKLDTCKRLKYFLQSRLNMYFPVTKDKRTSLKSYVFVCSEIYVSVVARVKKEKN